MPPWGYLLKDTDNIQKQIADRKTVFLRCPGLDLVEQHGLDQCQDLTIGGNLEDLMGYDPTMRKQVHNIGVTFQSVLKASEQGKRGVFRRNLAHELFDRLGSREPEPLQNPTLFLYRICSGLESGRLDLGSAEGVVIGKGKSQCRIGKNKVKR